MNNLASEFIWEINSSNTTRKRNKKSTPKKSTGSNYSSLKEELVQFKIEMRNRMNLLEDEVDSLKVENEQLRNEIKVYSTIMSEIQNSWT